ncbi:MAG: ABC transporter permease [Chloroflexota bacterium]|nr:ABC transporter permease [Chloroflexota bacterium]
MILSSTSGTTFNLRRFIVRYGVYISLGVLLCVAVLITPNLYSSQTLTVLLKQSAQLGLIAIGQTLVLLVAGLDLSVGSVIFLTSVVIARVSNGDDALLPLSIGLSFVLSVVIGLANGLLITKRKIPPFVATLAIFILVQGAVQAYTRGVPGGFVPDGLSIVNQSVGFISIPVVLWLGLTAIFAFVLRNTAYGRRLYAVGSNPVTARLSGLNVDGFKLSAYVLCSSMACVAGVVLTGYVGYVDRFIASGLDLDAIAAAVVGGTLFTGGRGSVLGTFAGVLLIQVLSTMALLLGLSIQTQFIIKGVVILAAVALYSLARAD